MADAGRRDSGRCGNARHRGRIHPYRYGGGISQRDWGGSRNPHVGSAERKAVCDQQAVERCERL